MNDYYRLKDVFPNGISGNGIFSSLTSAPWASSPSINYALDIEYFGNISGDKIISPLVKKLLNESGELNSASIQKLSSVLMTLYGNNWARLYKAYNAEYDPLKNYDMTETSEDVIDESNTGTQGNVNNTKDTEMNEINRNDEEKNTGTQETNGTYTYGQKVVNDGNGSRDVLQNVYGFNAGSNPAKANSETDGTTSNNTETHSGNDNQTDKRTDDLTRNFSGDEIAEKSRTVENSNTRTDNLKHDVTTKHNLSRSGNIGVTTSQQMLQSEIDLRKNVFFQQVFKDVDNILTIPIY